MSMTKRLLSIVSLLLMLPAAASAAKTVDVTPGDYVRTFQGTAALYYTDTEQVTFELDNAFLESIDVRKGDTVNYGDQLVTFTRKNDQAGYQLLLMNKSNADEDYRKFCEQMREELADREAAIALITDPVERKIARAEYELAVSEYEQNCYNRENNIADLQKQIDEMFEDMNTTVLESDFTGEVTWITYLKNGQAVHSWDAIMELTNKDRVLICVEDRQSALKYGMQVNINIGNNNKNSKKQTLTGHVVLADSILNTQQKTGYSFIMPDEPLDDKEPRLIKVDAVVEYVKDAVVVPTNTLTMSHGNVMVTLMEDGIEKERYVNRAQFHGTNAWILQGLDFGQSILAN